MITTKITGLSAQGSTEFNGLAYSNNDVAITMASDNVSQPGFKYIFIINDYKFYVAPNAALNGVFNCKTIFNFWFKRIKSLSNILTLSIKAIKTVFASLKTGLIS